MLAFDPVQDTMVCGTKAQRGSRRAGCSLGVFCVFGASPHVSKVEDEAVAFVEAAPGEFHLLGTNVALPFDLIQPGFSPRGLRPPEPRLHTALLWGKSGTSLTGFFHLQAFSCLRNNEMQPDEIGDPHLVADPSGEESHEPGGFVSLKVSVLDGFPPQEVVQLGGQHGTRHLLVSR